MTIERIFSRLMDLYDTRYKPPPPDAWVRDLAEFELNAFGYALQQLDQHHPTWPPTLIEFKRLCRAYSPPLTAAGVTDHKQITRHAGKGRATLAQDTALAALRERFG